MLMQIWLKRFNGASHSDAPRNDVGPEPEAEDGFLATAHQREGSVHVTFDHGVGDGDIQNHIQNGMASEDEGGAVKATMIPQDW